MLCIDFGTCNTTAAFAVAGKPHVVQYGTSSIFPTVACVMPDGNIQVCGNAEPLRERFPQYFLQEFKLQIADPDDINGHDYCDIVAEILRFVRYAAALDNNGREFGKVVLTVPAVYTASDPRKDIMRRAALSAGFSEVSFMNEPVAAAMHYAYVSGNAKSGLSLIYDLGGGTFDPVLVDTSGAEPRISGSGGARCGGQFFDAAVYRFVSQMMRDAGTPLERSGKLTDYMACRRLKETLSIEQEASQIMSNGKTAKMTREQFNEIIRPLLQLTIAACDDVIMSSGNKWSDVKQILFVGGSTAIPLIKEMLTAHLTSHNASNVEIIRTFAGSRDSYSHLYATCLGGISSYGCNNGRAMAYLEHDSKKILLREGINRFGRGSDNDVVFADDSYMSRNHFEIEVSPVDEGYEYTLTSVSQSSPTMLNRTEALDPRYVPFCRDKAKIKNGAEIKAGNTVLVLKDEQPTDN